MYIQPQDEQDARLRADLKKTQSAAMKKNQSAARQDVS